MATASHYDGSTALAEALLMAIRITRKKRWPCRPPSTTHRRVVETYFDPTGYEIIELPYRADGRTDLAALDGLDDLAAVAVQSPNFFGCIEDLQTADDATKAKEALFVASFTEPLAYRSAEESRQPRRRYRLRRGPEPGAAPLFRRAGPRYAGQPHEVRAQPAGPAGGTHGRRRRYGTVSC